LRAHGIFFGLLGRRTNNGQNITAPPKDSTLTPEALYTLRRKLIETQKLNAALLAEKTRNEVQMARLKALLLPAEAPKRESTGSRKSEEADGERNGGAFGFLTHTPAAKALGITPLHGSSAKTNGDRNAEKSTPLTTHTTFTTSQLPYLRQLLASLKPHLPTTALPSNTTPQHQFTSSSSHPENIGKKEELSRERKVYVESQSKRILERRGVDTKDGVEGVWEGSRMRGEEVRGLEGLVASMDRGRGADAMAGVQQKDEVEEEEDPDAMDTS
jgi:kinetochore protein Mis12/MTW1